MTTEFDGLIEHWRKLEAPCSDKARIHPADVGQLRGKPMICPSNAAEYFAHVDHQQNMGGQIIGSLLPKPYIGSLHSCRVLIVLANPGFSPGDLEEIRHRGFQEAVERNLRQEIPQGEFPFYFLNPEFAWHPGFKWWTRVLGKLITDLASSRRSTLQALSFLADHLACVESFPYYSKQFPGAWALKCPSSIVAKEAVNTVVNRQDRLVHLLRPPEWRKDLPAVRTVLSGGANPRNCVFSQEAVDSYRTFLPA